MGRKCQEGFENANIQEIRSGQETSQGDPLELIITDCQLIELE